jgi:ribosome-associated protein
MRFMILVVAVVGCCLLDLSWAWTTTTTTAVPVQHRRISTATPRTSQLLAAATSDSSSQQQQQQRGSSNRRTNQQTQQDMLRFMDQPVAKTAVTAADLLLDDGTVQLVHCIVAAADGRKADNIVALQVQHLTTLCSVLVVVSGNSRPQNQAIASAVSKAVTEQGLSTTAVPTEGTAESGWMLLDYGSVMVHIMTPKSRLFYNVEGQWKDGAVPLDLSHILVPNTVMIPADQTSTAETEEDDPFWS